MGGISGLHTKKQIPSDIIIKAFQKYNFDIRQGVKKLEAIYEGN